MKPDARGKENSDFLQNLVDLGLKFSWQEIYDPELYERMCEIYDSMMSAHSWDEMVRCSRELTCIMQEDYAALPFVQEPFCFAVREGAEEDFDIFSKTGAFKFVFQS